jgi:SAM-dependent methyltransferase
VPSAVIAELTPAPTSSVLAGWTVRAEPVSARPPPSAIDRGVDGGKSTEPMPPPVSLSVLAGLGKTVHAEPASAPPPPFAIDRVVDDVKLKDTVPPPASVELTPAPESSVLAGWTVRAEPASARPPPFAIDVVAGGGKSTQPVPPHVSLSVLAGLGKTASAEVTPAPTSSVLAGWTVSAAAASEPPPPVSTVAEIAPVSLSVLAGLGKTASAATVSADVVASGEDGKFDGAGATRRTMLRFQNCARSHYLYVAFKLRLDPIYAALVDETALGGDVLDVGCGRGQASIFLAELGRARSVVGVDFDQDKIEVANFAAGGSARFWVGDITVEPLPEADTILLLDVLHYLPLAAQDELLARVVQVLRPGGYLVLRDVEQAHGASGSLTRTLERIGVKWGANRGTELAFRDASQTLERLESLGLRVVTGASGAALELANRLVVAHKA